METKRVGYILFSILFIAVIQIVSCSKGGPPVAKKVNVTDTLHGVIVSDPYRWLENWDNPDVREWSEAQNKYARNYLNNLKTVDKLQHRIEQIRTANVVSYYDVEHHTGRLFAMKYQPPLNQSLLVVMPEADHPDEEKILVDPNVLDTTNSTSIDWYVPSFDGKRVAVSMSVGGSESGDLYIIDSETGDRIDKIIPRVNGGTAGGDVAWLQDGSGFYYTRYPRTGERAEEDLAFYQQVWFHRLGEEDSADQYVIGKESPRIAEYRLQMQENSGLLIITMQRGDSGNLSTISLNMMAK